MVDIIFLFSSLQTWYSQVTLKNNDLRNVMWSETMWSRFYHLINGQYHMTYLSIHTLAVTFLLVLRLSDFNFHSVTHFQSSKFLKLWHPVSNKCLGATHIRNVMWSQTIWSSFSHLIIWFDSHDISSFNISCCFSSGLISYFSYYPSRIRSSTTCLIWS